MSTARTPLSRDRVIASAIALADAEGMDAVSMRSVAGALGVVPMALYKHVSDKDDLVAGMIDAVITRYHHPSPGAAGPAAVRERILSARVELTRHPWLRGAVESARRRTLAVLGYMNAIAGDFVAGGYSYDLVHHAMHALGHRIWGFSPEAFADEEAPAQEPDAETMAAMAAMFPHVVAIAQESAVTNPTGACDEESEFAFTLDLLLDAFERLHADGWRSREHDVAFEDKDPSRWEVTPKTSHEVPEQIRPDFGS